MFDQLYAPHDKGIRRKKSSPASDSKTDSVTARLSQDIARLLEYEKNHDQDGWHVWDEYVYYYCDNKSELRRIIDEGMSEGESE